VLGHLGRCSKPLPGERLLIKHHANAFKETPLQQWLQERGVTHPLPARRITYAPALLSAAS
jgi:hypothetical protein